MTGSVATERQQATGDIRNVHHPSNKSGGHYLGRTFFGGVPNKLDNRALQGGQLNVRDSEGNFLVAKLFGRFFSGKKGLMVRRYSEPSPPKPKK